MMLYNHSGCFARRITLSCVLIAAGIGSPGKALRGQEPAPRVEKTDLYGDPLPAGAIIRLGTTRFRHGSPLLSGLKFLPDSTTLVHTADRSIRFWDSSSGRLLRELRTDPFSVRGVAVSPDGRLMALGGFWTPDDATPTRGEVRVLDVASGKPPGFTSSTTIWPRRSRP